VALSNSGAATRADLDAARTRFDTARSAVAAARAGLSSTRAGTEAQEASIIRSRVALEKSSIFAPFDGIIAYLNVEEGDYYSVGSTLGRPREEQLRNAPMVIIDPSQFEITVDIPAFDSKTVKPGLDVLVVQGENINRIIQRKMAPKHMNRSIAVPAKVFSVSPSIHPGDRATEVKIRTVPGASSLRDGEFVTCWIVTAEHENAIVAPFDGIIREEDEVYGFVLDQDHAARKRTLTIGIMDINGIEITKGLRAGELLVTKGRKGLSDGMVVDLVQTKTLDTLQLAPLNEVSEKQPSLVEADGEEKNEPEGGRQ
jgi:RND family efflux transporter MFP subunit